MPVCAIITAGGLGVRMGSTTPKQFLEINGRPIIYHCLERYMSARSIDNIIAVAPSAYIDDLKAGLKSAGYHKVLTVVPGGERRQDSVRNGLKALPSDCDIVAVQDSVRPFTRPSLIDRSVDAAREAGGCVVAVPVTDTIKDVGDDSRITKTIDRSRLWAAQTPQTFKKTLLMEVMERAYAEGFYGTDEASLFERYRMPVVVVQGDRLNIKITTPEDLVVAQAIAKEF